MKRCDSKPHLRIQAIRMRSNSFVSRGLRTRVFRSRMLSHVWRDRYEKIPDYGARGWPVADNGDACLRAGSHPGAWHVLVLSSQSGRSEWGRADARLLPSTQAKT